MEELNLHHNNYITKKIKIKDFESSCQGTVKGKCIALSHIKCVINEKLDANKKQVILFYEKMHT